MNFTCLSFKFHNTDYTNYKVCNDVPQKYLDTLFSPLETEIENNQTFTDDSYLPLAPNVEIDVKNIKKEKIEVSDEKKPAKAKGRPKTGNPPKVHFCEVCGKTFKFRKDYKVA